MPPLDRNVRGGRVSSPAQIGAEVEELSERCALADDCEHLAALQMTTNPATLLHAESINQI